MCICRMTHVQEGYDIVANSTASESPQRPDLGFQSYKAGRQLSLMLHGWQCQYTVHGPLIPEWSLAKKHRATLVTKENPWARSLRQRKCFNVNGKTLAFKRTLTPGPWGWAVTFSQLGRCRAPSRARGRGPCRKEGALLLLLKATGCSTASQFP